ncbi:MAG TPA: hypothetical protein VHC49_20025 [Mycobacteriales bacterium]|nr:hypothetical protein [Mycobacteriales bacterium]
MARWLSRSLAVAGMGGTLLVGGGAAALAAPAPAPQNPVGDLTKNLPLSVPTDLTKNLPLQIPTDLPVKLPPLQLPALPIPSGPLVQVCGIAAGLSGPINGSCPDSGQTVVTNPTPKPQPVETKTVTKTVEKQPVIVQQPVKVQPAPVPVQQVASNQKLAYTGFETMPIAAAGLAALIGGVVLTAVARPRKRMV